MALKAIVATLVLGSSSLALAETPRQARSEHRIHEERGERRVERRIDRREDRVEHRRFERERRFEHLEQLRRGRR